MGVSVYKDPRFKRWVCQLKFITLQSQQEVFGFLNLGNGDAPIVKKESDYRRAWMEANGGEPSRRNRYAQSIFKGKIYLVKISDVTHNKDQKSHFDSDIYSTVKEILKRTWP